MRKQYYLRLTVPIPEGMREHLSRFCEERILLAAQEKSVLESNCAFSAHFGWQPIVRASTYKTYKYLLDPIVPGYRFDNMGRHPVYMRGSFNGRVVSSVGYWSRLGERYLRRIRFTCMDEINKAKFARQLHLRIERVIARIFRFQPDMASDAIREISENHWIDGKPYPLDGFTDVQFWFLQKLDKILWTNESFPKSSRR